MTTASTPSFRPARRGRLILFVGLPALALMAALAVTWEYAPLWWPMWTMRWSPSTDQVLRAALVNTERIYRLNLVDDSSKHGELFGRRISDGTLSTERVLSMALGNGRSAERAAFWLPWTSPDYTSGWGPPFRPIPTAISEASFLLSRHSDPLIRRFVAAHLDPTIPEQCDAIARLVDDADAKVVDHVLEMLPRKLLVDFQRPGQVLVPPGSRSLARAVDAACDWRCPPTGAVLIPPPPINMPDHRHHLHLAGYAPLPDYGPRMTPATAEARIRDHALAALVHLDPPAARKRLTLHLTTAADLPVPSTILERLTRCGEPWPEVLTILADHPAWIEPVVRVEWEMLCRQVQYDRFPPSNSLILFLLLSTAPGMRTKTLSAIGSMVETSKKRMSGAILHTLRRSVAENRDLSKALEALSVGLPPTDTLDLDVDVEPAGQ